MFLFILKQKKVYTWFFLILLSPLVCHSKNEEPKNNLTACSFKISGLVHKGGTGPFVKRLKFIAKEVGFNIDVKIVPAKRCQLMFKNKDVDIYFPSNDRVFSKDLKQAKTIPFYVRKNFVFHKKNMSLKDIHDLKGKRISLTRGYDYSQELTNDIEIKKVLTSSDISNVAVLKRDRVDAAIMEEKSGLSAVKELGAKNIVYDKSTPIFTQDIYFSLQKKHKDLLPKINKAILKYKNLNEVNIKPLQ